MPESKQQLIERAKQHGRKIGYYLSILNIKQDHKEMIVEEMAKLELDEIGRLAEFLELKYFHQTKGQTSDKFRELLEDVRDKYRQAGDGLLQYIFIRDYLVN